VSTALSRTQRRLASKHMAKVATQYPGHLVQIPKDEWPASANPGKQPVEVWRSRDYLVQIYLEPAPCSARLSILRTSLDSAGGWQDDIPWTVLQKLKSECGRGMLDAVEVFPSDKDVVNVANIRHIFVMSAPLSFAWRK